jgi:hypothetical protein
VYSFSKDGILLILKDLKLRRVEEIYMYDWSLLDRDRFFFAFKKCETRNLMDFLSVLESYSTSLKLALGTQTPNRPILSRTRVEALTKFFQVFLSIVDEHREEAMEEKRYNRVCILNGVKESIRKLEPICLEGLKRIDRLASED